MKFLYTYIVLLIPLAFNFFPVEVLKLRVFDAFVETPEPSGNFVVLNITESDVEKQLGWPFPKNSARQSATRYDG